MKIQRDLIYDGSLIKQKPKNQIDVNKIIFLLKFPTNHRIFGLAFDESHTALQQISIISHLFSQIFTSILSTVIFPSSCCRSSIHSPSENNFSDIHLHIYTSKRSTKIKNKVLIPKRKQE
jgi:hypothetical protein